MSRFFRHASPSVEDRTSHIEEFLARVFRGSVAHTQDPRVATMTRGANLAGGTNGAQPAPGGGGGGGGGSILAGDVTGQSQNTSVSALQNVTLTLTSPTTGQVLAYSGTALVNTGAVGALTLTGDLTLSAHNLVTDLVTGTKLGTAASQKLSLFGAPPVVQQVGASAAAIAAITDVNARAAVSALQNALAALGAVTAPP